MHETIKKIIINIAGTVPDNPEVDLLKEGIIDSFDIVNIVANIEEKFAIEIDAEEIVPENFLSINTMVDLVRRCQIGKV